MVRAFNRDQLKIMNLIAKLKDRKLIYDRMTIHFTSAYELLITYIQSPFEEVKKGTIYEEMIYPNSSTMFFTSEPAFQSQSMLSKVIL